MQNRNQDPRARFSRDDDRGNERDLPPYLRGGDREQSFFGGRGGGLEEDYRFRTNIDRGGYDPREQQLGQRNQFQGRESGEFHRQLSTVIDRLHNIDQERMYLLSLIGVTSVGNRDFGREFDIREQQQFGGGYDVREREPLVQQGRQQQRGLGFRGVSPKNVQREDNQIKDEVITRLTEHDDIDPTEIQVEVKGGEVTLTGTVDDRQAKLLIEHITGNVIGVKDVKNEIRVSQQQRNENGTGNTGRQVGRDQARPQHAS